jgi:N-acetylglucosamine kinase
VLALSEADGGAADALPSMFGAIIGTGAGGGFASTAGCCAAQRHGRRMGPLALPAALLQQYLACCDAPAAAAAAWSAMCPAPA